MLVAFVWELTKETIHLPLGCLQGGSADKPAWSCGGVNGAADYDRGTPLGCLQGGVRPGVLGLGDKASLERKREFKLPWREAGPPNHHDDRVDSDQ